MSKKKNRLCYNGYHRRMEVGRRQGQDVLIVAMPRRYHQYLFSRTQRSQISCNVQVVSVQQKIVPLKMLNECVSQNLCHSDRVCDKNKQEGCILLTQCIVTGKGPQTSPHGRQKQRGGPGDSAAPRDKLLQLPSSNQTPPSTFPQLPLDL